MKSLKPLLILLLIIAVGVIFLYTFSSDDVIRKDEIKAWREDYESFLRTSQESPLDKSEDLVELRFYPIKPEYVVKARLEKKDRLTFTSIPASNGETKQYIVYGLLHFELLDKDMELTLYQDTKSNTNFFLPFSDLSNGKGTYGAGRHLPVVMNKTGILELDFNRAFNPYCAFNHKYVCPISPKENRLDIEVLAGEKVPLLKIH